MPHKNSPTEKSGLTKQATELTDKMVEAIHRRLKWYGSKVAAANYAGISRQNLGKIFRERGVPRDSEILLRLDEFSRMPVDKQKWIAGKPVQAPQKPLRMRETSTPRHESVDDELISLPDWLL